MSVLLPEIAWNLAVWRRLAQLEASLGYCFREKRLLREAPLLNYCGYSYTHYGYRSYSHWLY